MDNRWKFLYCRKAYEGSGDAEGRFDRAAGRPGQGCKAVREERPPYRRSKSDGEGNTSTEANYSTLTRKAATELSGTRTVNRHRWVRRES